MFNFLLVTGFKFSKILNVILSFWNNVENQPNEKN